MRSYAKQSEGLGVVTTPNGQTTEIKTVTCGHCQRICSVQAGTDGTGDGFAKPVPGLAPRKRPGTHVCHICWSIVCDQCHAQGICRPWEEQMRRAEAREQFLRSAGICAAPL